MKSFTLKEHSCQSLFDSTTNHVVLFFLVGISFQHSVLYSDPNLKVKRQKTHSDHSLNLFEESAEECGAASTELYIWLTALVTAV